MSSVLVNRVRSLWLNLSQSLGFVPGLIVAVFAALGIVLVHIDRHLNLKGASVGFTGDGAAARTVLSVIAGSLITVAGLTFSITMVVLQLASSQFSPRILRTFFGDRVTQVTIGAYVGTFVYSILVLRAVGSSGADGFVPRLSVTVAVLLGIAAVVLLVVFLNHVSRMVQVSHVTANIAHATLARVGVLYPDPYRDSVEDESSELLESWRSQPPGRVLPARPGYVQRIGLDGLAESAGRHAERVAILVCAGDFVSVETPIVETWPAAAAEECRRELLAVVSISSERDLNQDVDFGVRQLADTALKAISPGINDPMTAVTCISYLRSILVRLSERAEPSRVHHLAEHDLTVIVRKRQFDEYLEAVLQISRYVDGDAWVAGELLSLLRACAETALELGAVERLRSLHGVAVTVGEQAARQAKNERDRDRVAGLLAGITDLAGDRPPSPG
jgi:uncharacterized membrane protein